MVLVGRTRYVPFLITLKQILKNVAKVGFEILVFNLKL